MQQLSQHQLVEFLCVLGHPIQFQSHSLQIFPQAVFSRPGIALGSDFGKMDNFGGKVRVFWRKRVGKADPSCLACVHVRACVL